MTGAGHRLIAANLFVVAFGMSGARWCGCCSARCSPNRIRAAALGLAAAGQWAASWLITVTFPSCVVLGVATTASRAVRLLSGLFDVEVGHGDRRASRWRTMHGAVVAADKPANRLGPSA